MEILDGKKIKEEILYELKEKVSLLNEKLGLTVIQVGNDDASNVYINQKKKMCEYIGYNFNHIKLHENIKKEEVIKIITELNNNKEVTGILLQLPISKHLDENEIINYIDSNKDVDGLTDINIGKLIHNKKCLIPCTPLGIITLLDKYKINIEGKNIVVIGRSILVGKPISNLLINKGATVTICNSKTTNLKDKTKDKDIIISATGKCNLIKEDMVKENAIIIDVGITRDENNKLHGDVDFENVKEKTSYITPVPGGVGPMTIACLAINILNAYEIQKN